MATYLPPVDKPKSLMMKVMYRFARRMFGTVPTGMQVFTARMPAKFMFFYNKTYRLDRKLRLAHETALVIRHHVASINSCSFCMDTSRWFALRESVKNTARFDSLSEYRTSPHFSDAERAALDYVTELTSCKTVSPDTFAQLAGRYSEWEICDIVWLVASEHLANMTNIGLGIGSDGLCQLTLERSKKDSPDS
ncbi:MAG: carboxymuconolactone decarboxylase family protein [Candidatus Dormiibacterota bacterium]